jgi:predicted MPP superfamily phosphohydrolase
MFRTILLITYLIPNIYLFIRIWTLFIPKGYRLWYVLVYAFLFSLYPLTRILNGDEPGMFVRLLDYSANYTLPFFLYLFLLVLIIDILLLINLALRILPRNKIKKQTFRWKILIAIISISALTVIGGIINFNTIRISEFTISIPRQSSKLTSLKVAFVSDFHLDAETPAGFVKRFVEKVKVINPDLMLFGGDIIEGDGEDEKIKNIEDIIRSIKTRYGVYGVLGNHEHYAGQGIRNFFRNSGITILRDTSVIVDNSFIVAGRDDSHFRTRKSAEELINSIADSLPVILLDHRPTEINSISKTKADVVFSGHTHHGQLFPINFITRCVYELSYGYLGKGDTHFFVSSGIRLWGPPVRTTGKSEILIVNMHFIP